MGLSVKKLCEWKYDAGYAYVSVNEYTGKLDFITEDGLEKWYKDEYDAYVKNKDNPSKVLNFEDFRKKNIPDRIEDIAFSDAVENSAPDSVIIGSRINGASRVLVTGTAKDISELCKDIAPILESHF